ncbi:hypothetical protein BDR07DRAFT_1295496 [Suillus spraguei]|nr:hypothetical protein BDR07DRAFT_1295496 [Suillus spraguei]
MVANFVSADYGWLRSRDGKESARVLFKAGRAQDGYFTNQEIVTQAMKVMDILQKDYPDGNHVLVFDNAMMHSKHTDDALTAQKMPKNPSQMFGPTASAKDANGKFVLSPDGKQVKEKICMADTKLLNGDLQPLYFADGHPKAGWFKGMAQILVECRYINAPHLRMECKDFKCPPDLMLTGRDLMESRLHGQSKNIEDIMCFLSPYCRS